MNKQKGSIVIFLLFVVIISALSAGAFFYLKQENILNEIADKSSNEPDILSELKGTLVERIPEDAFGFWLFNSSPEADNKFRNSAWAKNGQSFIENLVATNKSVSDVKSLVDSSSKLNRGGSLKESLIYVSAGGKDKNEIAWGYIMEGADASKFAEDISYLRKALKDAGIKIEQNISEKEKFEIITLASKSGEDTFEPKKVYVFEKENLVSIGSDKELARYCLSKEDGIPSFINKDIFRQSVRDLPAYSERLNLAYIDIDQLMESSRRAANTETLEAIGSGALPMRSLVVCPSIKDFLEFNFRLLLDADKKADSVLFSGLSSSSDKEALENVPENPLFVLSIDGKTIASAVKAIGVANSDKEEMSFLKNMDILDSVDRVAFVIKIAPIGQSIMPLPDISIMLKTAKGNEVVDKVKQIVIASMQGNPALAGMKFKESDIGAGYKLHSLISPFGVGIFLASNEKFAYVASTDVQIKEIFAAKNTQSFFSQLDEQSVLMYAKNDSLANYFLSFKELASLLENISGLLSLYAPSEANTSDIFSEQNLKALREEGNILGQVTVEDNLLQVKTVYQPKK